MDQIETAAIYARKSTDESGKSEEARSVTRQVAHATTFARQHGWHVPAELVFVDDGISGAEFDLAARGRDQELVLFYAAAVFVAFHAGLVSMCRFSWQQRRFGSLAINLTGAAAVSFTLAINLARGEPIISIAAALLIAAGLYALWVRSGRPRRIRHVQPPPPKTKALG